MSKIFRVHPDQIDMSLSSWKDNPPFQQKEGGWPMTEETLKDLVKSGARLRWPLSEKYEHLTRL